MRRSLIVGAATMVAVSVGPVPSFAASPTFGADTTIVVRGAAFPTGREAQLSLVGCDSLYDRSSESLQPYLTLGPGTAPAGERSVGYDLSGGNAVGSLYYVNSLAATTVAGLSVYAADGAAGVAYAGYQMPNDVGTTLVWFGRSDLRVGSGTWQQVDATKLTYAWTKYDMATGRAIDLTEGTPSTVTDFLAAHGGDGAGFFTIGFGCDGKAFDMDAWLIGGSSGVTSYDLEGLTTSTSIAGATGSIVAGDRATIAGELRDGTGLSLSRATLILEAKAFGSNHFTTLEIVAAGGGVEPSATVEPVTQTTYRWRFVDRPLAEGSASDFFTVDVATRVTAAESAAGGGGTGQTIGGGTTPVKANLEATLWRVTPHGDVRLDASQTANDGTYRFGLPEGAQPGTDRYYVTVPAASGNLEGRSPSIGVAAGGSVPGAPTGEPAIDAR